MIIAPQEQNKKEQERLWPFLLLFANALTASYFSAFGVASCGAFS